MSLEFTGNSFRLFILFSSVLSPFQDGKYNKTGFYKDRWILYQVIKYVVAEIRRIHRSLKLTIVVPDHQFLLQHAKPYLPSAKFQIAVCNWLFIHLLPPNLLL